MSELKTSTFFKLQSTVQVTNFTACLHIYATVILDRFQGHRVICLKLIVLREIVAFVMPSWKNNNKEHVDGEGGFFLGGSAFCMESTNSNHITHLGLLKTVVKAS